MVVDLLAAQASTTTSMSSADGMIGVSTEAGGKVFDPLGLAELHSINPLVNPHPKVRGCILLVLVIVGCTVARVTECGGSRRFCFLVAFFCDMSLP